ncbi:hypothetical protein V5799_009026 [Amblyomma americanum]|uniref:Uncharacterized protein n=1 Tax=Amblyomma americanum TaxID=6943 RepID=A0AAQ4FC88_AMBAM
MSKPQSTKGLAEHGDDVAVPTRESAPGGTSAAIKTLAHKQRAAVVKQGEPIHQAPTATVVQPPGVVGVGRTSPRKAPRDAGFTGIDAIQVAPNVIVFSPRRTPLGTNAGPASEATSPELNMVQPQGQTPEEDRVCVQSWAMIFALTAPYFLSAWLLVLPFLVRSNRSALTILPTFASPTVTSTLRTPPLPTTAVPTTTVDIWQGIPADCRVPVSLGDTYGPTNVSSPSAAASQPRSLPAKPFFCLFNNSRFYDPARSLLYGIETMPMQFCSSIVYWSVGIENGSLQSRVPNFDHDHGLERIRHVASRRGWPDIQIILALGGYAEDSPHFTRLRSDYATLQRLLSSVEVALLLHDLNGVMVHWVTPDARCRGPNDNAVMGILLRGLREVFNRARTAATLSVMLDVRPENVALAANVAGFVDYFFLETHRVIPRPTTSVENFCEGITAAVHSAANTFAAGGRVPPQKVCITESLAPMEALGLQDPNTDEYGFVPGASLDWMPIYERCNDTSFCRDTVQTSSCVLHRVPAARNASGNYSWLNMVNSASTLHLRLNYYRMFGRQSTGRPRQVCVLVVDHDYDNFGDMCYGNRYKWYLLMSNLYYGSSGSHLTRGSIQTAAPRC